MKHLIFIISCLLGVSSAYAADFNDLHNTNFNPIGNYCSQHFEVDGSTLFATTVVNETLADYRSARFASCNHQFNCNGKTTAYTCKANICKGEGSNEIRVLTDGNVISTNLKGDLTKLFKSPNLEVYFCP